MFLFKYRLSWRIASPRYGQHDHHFHSVNLRITRSSGTRCESSAWLFTMCDLLFEISRVCYESVLHSAEDVTLTCRSGFVENQPASPLYGQSFVPFGRRRCILHLTFDVRLPVGKESVCVGRCSREKTTGFPLFGGAGTLFFSCEPFLFMYIYLLYIDVWSQGSV